MQINTNKTVAPAIVLLSLLPVCGQAMAAPAIDGSVKYKRNNRENFALSCQLDKKGVLLEEQGKAKEAIELFKKAIAIYPHYSVHYCNLGNALSDLGRYSEAIEQYKKAVSISPDLAVAYSNMADAMCKSKDYAGAELACMSAIRSDPGYVPALTNLAEVYIETNRPREAVTALNKAKGLSISAGMRKIINADLERANKLLAATKETEIANSGD